MIELLTNIRLIQFSMKNPCPSSTHAKQNLGEEFWYPTFVRSFGARSILGSFGNSLVFSLRNTKIFNHAIVEEGIPFMHTIMTCYEWRARCFDKVKEVLMRFFLFVKGVAKSSSINMYFCCVRIASKFSLSIVNIDKVFKKCSFLEIRII